jgi:uncharacterized glyoxalase superfamily protein PhnB
MDIRGITPILNVSDVAASLAWFEKLGWSRSFSWNDGGSIDGAADGNVHGPASFAGLCRGDAQLFLCRDGQGGRGTWICWLLASPADVDAAHATALREGMRVALPPTDEPWGMREFHLVHPDGHVFRIGAGLGED